MDALLHNLIFYILALIVIGSAAITAFARNLVHAAFSLLFTFFGLACLYIYLAADFVGLSQVIVYVGGILILLLFGVMFTGNVTGVGVKQVLHKRWGALALVLFLFVLLITVLGTPWPAMENPADKELSSTVSPIGILLLTDYLLPFEIASLLLLIALIGAVVIAQSEPKVEGAPPEAEDTTPETSG